MQSMTGFGAKETNIAALGKICVELKSSNHKFLETVLHLPEGLLSLEDRLKKDIETKIKRGRITCAVNIMGGTKQKVFINKPLLKNYISTVNAIKKQFGIRDEASINTLINLPGVLSLEENKYSKDSLWPVLRALLKLALEELLKTRKKEGRAIYVHLKRRSVTLRHNLDIVKTQFKKALKDELDKINTDEERASFLKNTDITEEMERLAFHIGNFKNKISQNGPIGKELDFIAQEMQREANTMAAKTFAASISARVVQIKSQIEKIREQVQNIE
ncbi:MAG: YicC family protein [Candidatus Omnitrophica bacterium]|nr:YicC family protein [Candidatus Omnitrophota bacterium]